MSDLEELTPLAARRMHGVRARTRRDLFGGVPVEGETAAERCMRLAKEAWHAYLRARIAYSLLDFDGANYWQVRGEFASRAARAAHGET